MQKNNISILVLTLNEEQNLPACLESVQWADDIVVLDSLSTDGTEEIARKAGARVVQRKFDNWATHQNWAMENIKFKHSWVFYLDADERMTDELRQEITAIAADSKEPRVAFYCSRKNYFMGQWLKHSFRTEAIMRFFRPEKIRFERLVNPTPVVSGPNGHLRSPFLHYNFSKGLTEWIAKHNQYSLFEAMEGMKILRGEAGVSPSFFSKDKALRRKALKTLSFRLPFRPTLRFLYTYVFRLGFLDGRAGFVYCRLISMYEYMIVVKMEELKRTEQGAPVALGNVMRILLLNQCFYPDVASTAQHLTDLAVGLAERGHDVTVVASQRGYDNPATRFPKREDWRRISIIRIPTLGLGKGAKWRRAADFGSYMLSCVLRLISLPKFDVVLAMTSPPLISFLGALFVRWKGGRFVFWVMDLNPDEAIAAGWLRPDSIAASVLQRMLRYSLLQSKSIVVLDRFMKDRIVNKGIPPDKIAVIPPWSHDDVVAYDPPGRRAFREQYGLADKYVVMYSGNHSPCHPLDTLLRAAEQLKSDSRIAFCFVGGGSEFRKVQGVARDHSLSNIICLPYQPLDQLSASLSSADLHVVVMGDAFTGIVHPCKIYNILILGVPVLAIGPSESHIGDVLRETKCNGQARTVPHGNVAAVVDYLLKLASRELPLQRETNQLVADRVSKSVLMPRMIGIIEAKESA